MFKEIIIGWLTFIFALALAIGIIFVVGVFVLWVADKVDTLSLYDGTLPEGETTLYFILEYNSAFLQYINTYILNSTPGYFEVDYYHDVTFVIS